MITLQNIFDAAWQAFIVEKRPPSVNVGGGCEYLNPDGLKCAVGLCLPDGHPAQQAPMFFDQLVDEYPDLFAQDVRTCNSRKMFQSRLHDALADQRTKTWKTYVDIEAEYRKVAKDYGLTIPNATPSA